MTRLLIWMVQMRFIGQIVHLHIQSLRNMEVLSRMLQRLLRLILNIRKWVSMTWTCCWQKNCRFSPFAKLCVRRVIIDEVRHILLWENSRKPWKIFNRYVSYCLINPLNYMTTGYWCSFVFSLLLLHLHFRQWDSILGFAFPATK